MTTPAETGAHRRSVSIRLRLTLLYTGILALTLIGFSLLLYVVQTQTTYGAIKTNLVREAQMFGRRDAFPSPPGEPSGGGPTRVPPDAILGGGTLPGRWIQTRTITGTVIGQTFDLQGAVLPLSDAGLRAVQGDADWFETGQAEEQPVLVYSKLFTPRGGEPRIVQIAFPIAQPQQYLNTLGLLLLSGSALAILAAFIIGWVLAGAALNPIQRIAHTAQVIGTEHDFSRRVQHAGPADEVGQLAVTFNGMLAELESAFRQLEVSLDSQRRFVADASHELRTPLTTVRGNIELLRREPPVERAERSEILADTTAEVDRLIRLVNQLLVLARADAGQNLRAEPVPVQPLIEDVCRQARALAPDSVVECVAEAEGAMVGDRDALKQVLLILLDNACRHGGPGARVGIASEQQNGQVTIRVHDSGPGIPPAALPHIFERFYRGQVSRSGAGAGLGLAIAKELVEAQGGQITVDSRPGHGATFTLRFPAA